MFQLQRKKSRAVRKPHCSPCPKSSFYSLRCLVLILGLLLSPTALLAAQVTLAWDASGPKVEGYRVFRRLGGQRYIYAQPVWSGPETTCVVSNLPNGTTSHFVVRAYAGAAESADSNEVTFDPHPDDAVVVDSDGDGMSDLWEIAFGLDPLVDDTGLDGDGDGIVNSDEYQAGSDPTVPDLNQPPLQPVLILESSDEWNSPLTPAFTAADFFDPDPYDSHLRTQWRFIHSATGQTVLDIDSRENWLTRFTVPRPMLDPDTAYTCEVRYFDRFNQGSPWSEPFAFATAQRPDDPIPDPNPDDPGPGMAADLNEDGIADDQQAEVMQSVMNPITQSVAGISIADSDTAQTLLYAAAFDPLEWAVEVPADRATTYGILGYKIKMAQVGQTTPTTLYFPADQESFTLWACIDDALEVADCTDQVVATYSEKGTILNRMVTDGGPGDADGTANGIIVGFLMPQSGTADDGVDQPQAPADSQSAGSGGCFIRSVLE